MAHYHDWDHVLENLSSKKNFDPDYHEVHYPEQYHHMDEYHLFELPHEVTAAEHYHDVHSQQHPYDSFDLTHHGGHHHSEYDSYHEPVHHID